MPVVDGIVMNVVSVVVMLIFWYRQLIQDFMRVVKLLARVKGKELESLFRIEEKQKEVDSWKYCWCCIVMCEVCECVL